MFYLYTLGCLHFNPYLLNLFNLVLKVSDGNYLHGQMLPQLSYLKDDIINKMIIIIN